MKLVYLSGGVGGARLLSGLDRIMPAGELTIVVNTADDFVHWGLRICPDLDTVMYNLAGMAHLDRGWGLQRESFAVFQGIRALGGQDWFSLSDQDLATHIFRTELLNQGQTLTQVTSILANALGVRRPLLPMTNRAVHTVINTQDGRALPFQQWFVRERAMPAIAEVSLAGEMEDNPAVLDALQEADAVLIGPSNPYVSIDPILHGIQTLAVVRTKPCFAVSPIVGGKAIKGPLSEMMQSLTGAPASAQAIADHYATGWGLQLAGLVIEVGDHWQSPDLAVLETNTIMRTNGDKIDLARACIELIEEESAR